MPETTSIEEQLDREFAEAWKPAPGDKLVGKVVDLSERESAYGRYPIVTVETAGGEEIAVHAFHEVLQNELARLAPSLDTVIGVKYVGKHPERGYHVYRVRRLGEEGGVSWSRYSSNDEELIQAAEAADSQAPLGERDGDVPF